MKYPLLAHLHVQYRALVKISDKSNPERLNSYMFWQVEDSEPQLNGGVIIVATAQEYQETFMQPSEEAKKSITETLGQLGMHNPEDPDAQPLFDEIAGQEVLYGGGFVYTGEATILSKEAAEDMTKLCLQARMQGTRTF